jgi:ATP-dependent DNA helicase DinG
VVSNLLNKFPEGYSPNKQQVKLLKSIDEAFDSGYKFVICNAPTGSGKSFVSKTVSNTAEDCTDEYRDAITSYAAYRNTDESEHVKPFGCTALTITKSLQDQYKELFKDTEVLKGKSNYKCAVDEDFTVDVAPCLHLPSLKTDCWAKHKCPYYEQRNRALTSRFNALNYNMFFALPEHLKKRQFIICDEASELEDQLVKEFTCKIEYSFLRKCNINVRPFISTQSHEKWLSNILVEINDAIKDLEDDISSNKKAKPVVIMAIKGKMLQLVNLQRKLELITDTWMDSEYVHEKDITGVTFMPLKVNKLSHRLFDYADKVILMSATIIDPNNFCKSLGIDRFKYVEAESSFDPENAPIVCNTKYKLNYYTMKSNLPKIAKQIKALCEHHGNDKGIIHTHNNTITKELTNTLSGKRYLFREPGVKNEDILETHYNTDDPTVLISPSMSHGVDLKGDLARFQIIVKAPFLPTRDVRIERLMKDDFDWYQNKMLCSLIQSCGRGIRSKDDHCITYILDGTIAHNIVKTKHKLPKYFIDRFV